jgi:SAM-dependent methyltransferase
MERSEPPAYTVNDLPRFSPWPARLLGLVPWDQRVRSRADVHREFEREKWGSLRARIEGTTERVTIDTVEEWVMGDVPDGLCSHKGRLELVPARAARARYLRLIEELVARHLPAPAIAELGCGFGSVILRLARRFGEKGLRWLAGDLSPSAVEIVRRLAAASGHPVEAGLFDFSSIAATELDIPPGSLLLTSYAMHYLPAIPKEYIEILAAYRPRAVIHLEPCIEHCDPDTLLGLLRRRYIEVNDYNTNLVTLLRAMEQAGQVEVLEETPDVFGQNPLLPASVVIWKPCLG